MCEIKKQMVVDGDKLASLLLSESSYSHES